MANVDYFSDRITFLLMGLCWGVLYGKDGPEILCVAVITLILAGFQFWNFFFPEKEATP
jgi:hypothetical protein